MPLIYFLENITQIFHHGEGIISIKSSIVAYISINILLVEN